jgi:hypothetical protein
MGLEDHWKPPVDPSIIAKAIQAVSEETIILGDDVANFLKSNIGQYLMARAQQQMMENLSELIAETDPGKIKILQFNIHLASAVPQWLEDAINSGRSELELKFNNEGE